MSEEPDAPRHWPRIRRAFTGVGVAGTVLGLVAAGLLGLALSKGVHCPDCARGSLGDRYLWWSGYFLVKDVLWGAGGLAGLASAAVAPRRRWGIIAVALALAMSLTPM